MNDDMCIIYIDNQFKILRHITIIIYAHYTVS